MMAWLFGKGETKSSSQPKENNDFISFSSHELRSPLSIIKWYTEILLDGDAGPLTEDQRKYLSVIETSNQRAIDLVRSLLNVSRLDLGTFSICPEEVEFDTLLSQAISSVTEVASKKEITIKELGMPLKRLISLDKKITLLILKQVLSNAIAYSDRPFELTIESSVVPKQYSNNNVTLEHESILVTVTDSGIGIPENDVPKIFSKMFRGSNVKESNGPGSGLGLYVAKTVLNYVGGEIWFTSKENQGSVFFISFPTRGMEKKIGKTTLD